MYRLEEAEEDLWCCVGGGPEKLGCSRDGGLYGIRRPGEAGPV